MYYKGLNIMVFGKFWCLLRLFCVYSFAISPHEAYGIQEVSGSIPLISTKKT